MEDRSEIEKEKGRKLRIDGMQMWIEVRHREGKKEGRKDTQIDGRKGDKKERRMEEYVV